MLNDLRIDVFEVEADEERIDRLTTALINLLRELDIEYIHKAQKDTPLPLAKGDPLTIGAIVLGITSAALPSLIAFLQQWAIDRKRVTIETPSGIKVEFSPDKRYTEEELITLIKKLNRIK